MLSWIKRAAWLVAVLVVGVGVTWFAWPQPIPADLATVSQEPMQVTVDDEARTSVRHVYTVSAPLTGRVLRISSPAATGALSLHVGDEVIANQTVVAVMQPALPALLDPRSRQELQAAAEAAAAAVSLAEAEVRRIEVALDFAKRELARAQSLASSDTISAQALDAAGLAVAANQAALDSAKAALGVRQGELQVARARQLDPATDALNATAGCCVQIRAPASGRVLRVVQQSEGVVAAGTPLVEIGDPRDLEIVADLLSTDAVQIRSGAAVTIDGWGGPVLHGRVTRVEPQAFVKVSALGIEEQRVRTTIDFTDPPEAWARLGNNFRVIVHVSLWGTDSATTVPVAALFRRGDDWAVFRVQDGAARVTAVSIGRRNDRVAEVLGGLVAGDRVVLHPSDRIRDGSAVTQREVD